MGDLADGTAIKIREYETRIAELEAEVKRLRERSMDAYDSWAMADDDLWDSLTALGKELDRQGEEHET